MEAAQEIRGAAFPPTLTPDGYLDTSFLDLDEPGEVYGSQDVLLTPNTYTLTTSEGIEHDAESGQVRIERPAYAYRAGDLLIGDAEHPFLVRVTDVYDDYGELVLTTQVGLSWQRPSTSEASTGGQRLRLLGLVHGNRSG